ncbi:MAG: YdcF family protein [Acidobacteriota bacterium]|nr:YdcF family protein [Acidobacteriota bacterium]
MLVLPLILLLLVIAAYLLRCELLTAAGRALVEDDGPQKADCILVLGGDDYGDRIVKAARLAQAGFAPFVIVDGPAALIGHESDATIQYAVQKGFPASLFHPVWLPPGVDSTSTEVQYVASNVLRPKHLSKVLLVTSNYHTRRAARFIRKEVPWLQVIVVPAPDPFFKPDGWWKTRNGKKTFLLEWTKTVTEWWGA